MIVISGCPRSGTSLMMDIMRETFGEGRIIGEKFPQEKRIKRQTERQEGETDQQWAVREYIMNKDGSKQKALAEFAETKDMNPNGFWECGYTVRGIQYVRPENAPKATDICKVVSQGLAQSNPQYIDKVVYMLRHPRAVAKSQERLKGRYGGLDNPERGGKEVREHSPKMFVQVTKAAASWLRAHAHVPVLLVDFDDLIEDPAAQLQRVQDFLGEGDFTQSVSRIEPKLRRSYPQEVEHPLWGPAEALYSAMSSLDYDAVADVEVQRVEREKRRVCVRLGRAVVDNECALCRADANTRRNYAVQATRRGIAWQSEPCVYECLEEGKTIEESIASNHWANLAAPIGEEYWCPRAGAKVNPKHCEACREYDVFRAQLKQAAEDKLIDWRNEPCVYETSEGPEPHVTEEQSIASNHWL